MKSVRSVSFGVICCCGCCVTIFVFGTATVRMTVFVSGFAIFLASATTLLLVPVIQHRTLCDLIFTIDCKDKFISSFRF